VDPERYTAAMDQGNNLPGLHSPLFTPLPAPTIGTGVRAFTALARSLLAPASP
jgi:hypothetical protein